jgi:hypothetical protein
MFTILGSIGLIPESVVLKPGFQNQFESHVFFGMRFTLLMSTTKSDTKLIL